jgi:uncharacterized membrane protein
MASFHVYAGADDRIVHPDVRRIGFSDLAGALRQGFDDFLHKPSHVIFLCILYPLIGVVLATWTSGAETLPLLFPLMSGFALIGPLAAVGLYEISRRREAGLQTSWRDAFDVRHSPAVPAIVAIGLYLLVIFLAWMLTAQALYTTILGPHPPVSLSAFVDTLLGTDAGFRLIVIGNLVGAAFALLVLATTSVAFPVLLDRDVGAVQAVSICWRVFAANPLVMIAGGVIVGLMLAVASIPLFAGLAVAVPVLGHATWHLYRRAVEPPRHRTVDLGATSPRALTS